MKKKKVIHVLFSGNVSGAENIAMKIITVTNKQSIGYCLSPSGNINNVLKEKNITHLEWKNFSIIQFIKFLVEIKPDVVHAHDFKASVLSAIFVWRSRIISHLHQNPPWLEKLNFKSILYYLLSFRFNTIVLVSDWKIGKKNILNNLNHKINIIPNYIDFNEIKIKANTIEKVPEYDLIFLGRLSPEKDPLRFLEVVEKISLIKNDITIAIVGDGSLMNSCREFVNNKLSHLKIDFYGYLSNPYPILKNSKAIVLTSKWEGFGLVAVEAAILNVRVVASACGGLENIVNENIGILCKTNSEFIDAILNVLNHDKNSKLKIDFLSTYGDEEKWRKSLLTLWGIQN